MDFTPDTYKLLLQTLLKRGFTFLTFFGSLQDGGEKFIILRHDVDRLPGNSLRFARIEADLGIRGSYFFRVVNESWNEKVIREIAGMGHEVGYHYEDLSFAWTKLKSQSSILRKASDGKAGLRARGEELERRLIEIGITSFTENLEKLRQIVPVKTICMHGSPMSRWDSRLLWKYYDYHDFGIIGEPYFDVNFDEVLYLTDSGRRWDGEAVSVRDKASGIGRQVSGRRTQPDNPYQIWKVKPIKYREYNSISLSPHLSLPPSSFKFHSTFEIINAAGKGNLPDKIMMTFHPQRWTDNSGSWMKELIWQNMKNLLKYFMVRNTNKHKV